MNADDLLRYYERIADAPGAVARLRRFILDLAVRGKLVPQMLDDELASQLLRRIADEKARLVHTGDLPKPKSLPAVDEPPHPLPHSWVWVRIREIAGDRRQAVPKAPFTYIDVTAIDKEVGAIADPKILTPDEAPSRARKLARKGDVIYSCVRPYLLNVAVIEVDFDPAPIVSTAFAVLNGFGLVLPRYIWIALRSPPLVAAVEQAMRGQAYPAINDSDFGMLPFPLPPLAEQHRIVTKVDELMALCDRLEAARARRELVRDQLTVASLARLNTPDPETFRADVRFALSALPALAARSDQVSALRRSILSLAVKGRLVQQDPADLPASALLLRIEAARSSLVAAGRLRRATPLPPPTPEQFDFSIPAGWIVTRLGTAFDVRDGTHDTPKYVDVGYPLITSKNLSSGRLTFDEVRFISESDHRQISERSKVEGDDVLFAMIGSIGNPVIVDTDRAFSIKNVALIKYFDRSLCSPRFLCIFLEHAAAEMKALAAGGLQPFVSLGFLRGFPMALPSLEEQLRIVTKVGELMALYDQLEASLSTADDHRRRLLEALLHNALQPSEVALEAA